MWLQRMPDQASPEWNFRISECPRDPDYWQSLTAKDFCPSFKNYACSQFCLFKHFSAPENGVTSQKMAAIPEGQMPYFLQNL